MMPPPVGWYALDTTYTTATVVRGWWATSEGHRYLRSTNSPTKREKDYTKHTTNPSYDTTRFLQKYLPVTWLKVNDSTNIHKCSPDRATVQLHPTKPQSALRLQPSCKPRCQYPLTTCHTSTSLESLDLVNLGIYTFRRQDILRLQ